jgi:transposase
MATPAATRMDQEATHHPTLFLAFDLGVNPWKLGFPTGPAQRLRERRIPAGAVHVLHEEIARAKPRFDLPDDARVVSCDEAGRDGFWLHRCLLASGVENLVVDSARIAVNRRHRRAKTARLDVHKLLTMLLRPRAGARKVWSVVRVPSVADEDRRQLHRELLTTQRDRTRVITRMTGLLAGYGVRLVLQGEGEAQRAQARQWAGSPRPAALQARLQREWQQVQWRTEQIVSLEAERRAILRTREEPVVEPVRQLATLRGIGVNSAGVFVMACVAWRDVQTPKQGGALAGLTPTPYQRGQASRDLGITKAGNGSRRTMAVELAWGWVRFQPESALTPWYQARFGRGSARLRKIGIVALARKVPIALWRFLNTGGPPAGAMRKVEVAV